MRFPIRSTSPAILALADAIEPYQKPGDMALIARTINSSRFNHYWPHFIKADSNLLGASFGAPPEGVPRTAIGWPIVPAAFRDTLLDIHDRFGLPIRVENGTAADDTSIVPGALRIPGGSPICRPIPTRCRKRCRRARMSGAICVVAAR